MDVVALLRSKNRCLEKYLQLSVDFWEEAEKSDLSGLSAFEMKRDATLKAIDLFDRKLGEAVSLLPPDGRTQELVETVKQALQMKEDIIHRILNIDLKIIAKIEDEKAKLFREVTGTRKG